MIRRMAIVFQPQSVATGTAPPDNPEEFREWALRTIAAMQRDFADLELVIAELQQPTP